ncbi:MAG: alpha-E domain-containing protein [Candidatus Binatus sp.]
MARSAGSGQLPVADRNAAAQSTPWEPLLAIFNEREEFLALYATPDEASVLNFFTLDPRNPNSIRSCITIARSNARALRHDISAELWLDLNTLYLAAQQWTPEVFHSPGVFAFFAELKDSFYRIAGIRQSTLPRDLAYDFMELGMMLERAEDVSRMLDAKYHFLLPRLEDVGGAIDLLQWTAVLRSASGLAAYRKRFGSAIAVSNVVGILLFDETFPRSVRYSIERIQTSLSRIAASATEKSPAVAAAGNLLEEIRTSQPAGIINAGLHQFMLHIQDSCTEISDRAF